MGQSALATSLERPASLFDPAFWRGIAPSLDVSASLDLAAVRRRILSRTDELRVVEAMRRDGFFVLAGLLPVERMARIHHGVEAVRARFGHEVFSLMFDEVWITLAELSGILELVLGPEHRIVPLPYVNYVPPGGAGFDPHRDRLGDALADDGGPNMVTAWVSLTDATPERACLSVLPASFDPNFPDQLHRREVPDLRDVRAVPVSAGSLVCFNQALLHWGTRNSADVPRVSFAFEVERAGVLDARQPAVSLNAELEMFERCGFIGATVGMLSRSNVSFSAADLDRAQEMCERVHGRAFDAFFHDAEA